MSKCDVCGEQAVMSMGGATLCRPHSADVQAEIDALRAQGKQVNALGIARRMYRELNDTNNYMLRDLPAEMMRDMKQYALDNGGSVRDVILVAVAQFLTANGETAKRAVSQIKK